MRLLVGLGGVAVSVGAAIACSGLCIAGAAAATRSSMSAAQSAKAADQVEAARTLALERAARWETDEALKALDSALASHPNDGSLLTAKGKIWWDLRRSRSAIDVLENAARDPKASADAHYELGKIYFFKGWESEGAYPGWHEESEYRPRAIAEFEAAIKADPRKSDARTMLADALLLSDRPADALTAYDAVIKASPMAGPARVGRWKALKALNRSGEIQAEVVAAAQADDVKMLAAARDGYALLGQDADAKALDTAIEERFPTSPPAAQIASGRIAAARQAKQYPTVVEQARAFTQKFPASPQLPTVCDALIEALAADPSTDASAILTTVDARVKMRPDPAAYVTGANALLARRALLDDAIRLADGSVSAADTLVNENLGSYKMSGKVQGSLGRSRAAAADIVGWASFLKNDVTKATSSLEEAERLSRGLDMVNQFHLAELARSKGDLEAAREHYLNSLTLAQGPPPIKEAGKKALAEVYAKLGNDPAEFESYLKGELDRRGEARRTALLQTMVDQKVPDLRFTGVDGKTVEIAAMRGKVLLLNFFSSW